MLKVTRTVSNYGNREWSISVFAFSICSVFAFSTFLIFSLNIKKRKRKKKNEMTTFSFHSSWFVVYIVDHYFWSLPPVVCRAIALRYLCLLAHSGFQHILCCVFVLFVFVLCTLCCQYHWIVNFRWPLRYSLTCIYYKWLKVEIFKCWFFFCYLIL
jgi:hypothetical protein